VSDADTVPAAAFTRVSKPDSATERAAMFYDRAAVYRIDVEGPKIAGNLPSLFGCGGTIQPMARLRPP
jgi:hypothetical protein